MHTNLRPIRLLTRMALVAAIAIAPAACGDDDDDGAAAGGEAYCDVAAELAAGGESAPTTSQLDRLRAAAPDEIADEVDQAADILEEHLDELEAGDTSVFEDPDLQSAIGTVQAYDGEHCDYAADGSGEG